MNALPFKSAAIALLAMTPLLFLGCNQSDAETRAKIIVLESEVEKLREENAELKAKVEAYEKDDTAGSFATKLKSFVSKDNLDKLTQTDLGKSINAMLADQDIDPETAKILMASLTDKLKDAGLDQDTIQSDMDKFKTDITTLQDVIEPGKELTAGERLRVIAALNNMLKNVDEIEKRVKTEFNIPEEKQATNE